MDHWYEAAEAVRGHVLRIESPTGSGTGFFISSSAGGDLVGVATAAHVVMHGHAWEQPFRLTHAVSGKSVLLRPEDRAVLGNWERDTAALVFRRGDLGLPATALETIDAGNILRVGVEVGWLGYPGLVAEGPCFFAGRVSLYRRDREEYLVDGVAIPGVSGGPAFDLGRAGRGIRLVGVLSAYIPNRLTGESLPGLSVVMNVSSLRSQIEDIRSLGAAKDREADQPDSRAPSQPPDTEKGSRKTSVGAAKRR